MGNEKSLPDHRCNSVQAHYTQHKRHSQPSSPSNRHSTSGSPPPKQSHHQQRYAPTSGHQRHSSANEFSTSTQATSRPLSRTDASTTKSYTSSSAYSAVTLSTHLSKNTQKRTTAQVTNGRVGSGIESKQTKYLKEQLYIKSYLDIVEQDRLARNQFKTAKPGIRNYTPKILGPKPTLTKNEVDVWI